MLCLSLPAGWLLYRQMSRLADTRSEEDEPEISLLSLLGLLVITIYFSFVSLFFPVNYLVHLPLVALLVVGLRGSRKMFIGYLQERRRTFKPVTLPLFLVFAVLLFIQSLKHPFVTDTGLYHAQTIQWFEKFSVVPGLGNLHGRFAFNSHFHLLTAAFNFSVSGHDLHLAVNGFVLLMLMGLFSRSIVMHFKDHPAISFFCAASVLILTVYYRDWISSPTPDIPATVFVLLIFYLLVRKINLEGMQNLTTRGLTVLFVAICLLTLKLSVFPIGLAVVYLAWASRGSLGARHVFFAAGTGVVVLLPWFTRNIILSGYLIYPFPSLDLFSFDWKIPVQKVIVEKEWVKSFARMASYDWVRVSRLSFGEWFPAWFWRQWWIDKVIFIIASGSPVLVLLNMAVRKGRASVKVLPVWSIAWLCMAVWFILAPAFRFGHGFIIACLLLTCILLASFRVLRISSGLLYVACLVFGLYSIVREQSELSLMAVSIFPEKYARMPVDTSSPVTGAEIRFPASDELCWNEPLPCTPYRNPGLRSRGVSLQSGFRIEKEDLVKARTVR
jgi:hypothetical protein